jgi:hypothetical protein
MQAYLALLITANYKIIFLEWLLCSFVLYLFVKNHLADRHLADTAVADSKLFNKYFAKQFCQDIQLSLYN